MYGKRPLFKSVLYVNVFRLPHVKSSGRRIYTIRRFSSIRLPAKSVVFSGIQPTGVPHLGNFLGALKQWVQLQECSDPSTTLFFSIVDLHALTAAPSRVQLQQWKRQTLATLLAIGLDPERSNIFFQSDVPAHSELMWILSCTASVGYLSRMTQWKSKISSTKTSSSVNPQLAGNLRLGLFSYPVLQAADILAHGATHVPVGEDQKQHLEFARECAQNFNNLYGDTLIEPNVILTPARRIMSLKDPQLKMSKSHSDPRSRIILTDTLSEIRTKINLALTDSLPGISYDIETRPGISNLLNIFSQFDDQGRQPEMIAKHFDALGIKIFKNALADCIDHCLGNYRRAYTKYTSSSEDEYLMAVSAQGARLAQANSRRVIELVRERIGLR